MAKRPTVEVDEQYLLEVMAGGSAFSRKEEQPAPAEKPPVTEEKQSEAQPVETVESKEAVKPVRKKKEAQDYETVFLERKAGAPRRQTYISAAHYDKIISFLPVIAGGVSITVYINNILTHHLEQYKDDINELYERKTQKPF